MKLTHSLRSTFFSAAFLSCSAVIGAPTATGLAGVERDTKAAVCVPNSFTNGPVRLQALTPTLLRLEYSSSSHFVDEPSVSVINRDRWEKVPISASESDGWLVVTAGKIIVRYKTDSGPFSTNNLRLTWRDNGAEHDWKPGDKDDQNLGGVPASLDNRSTTAVTDPGPLSRKGYYLLDDSKSALFDTSADWVKTRPASTNLDWYFLAYNQDYKSALAQLSRLVGCVPMLPRYAFGAWFGSRAGYSGEQWKMIIKQFRDEKLPVDLLVIDSDSKTKMVWTGYDWDLEQVPDPVEFYHWMQQRGMKVTVNEHYAALTRDSDKHFDVIREEMGMPAGTKEIGHNIGDKKYAELFMDLLHKPDLDNGMAFWWQDGAAGAGIDGLDNYLWTRHVEYTGSQIITGKRTTAFCRLGTQWGSHRYGVYFTGDLNGVWESLPVLIPATVRGGNQLTPYMNNLCCGVFVVDLPPELYERWIQFSCFSPTIWFHGLWGLRLPWEYGHAAVENYQKFVGLRYALVPYIYTCSRIAHDTGLPLMRGTYLEYPDQEQAYDHPQQYLFGRDLLVAPISAPGNGKPVRKEVFLPQGDDWFDYFTGTFYRGGQTFIHDCPIDRMPVFVRAGSILPMAPTMEYTDQKPVDPLTLDVWSGPKDADFKLYEDDGTSIKYRNGEFAWTSFRFLSGIDGKYKFVMGPAQGKFKGQLARRKYLIRVHGLFKPESISLNNSGLLEIDPAKEGNGWWWNDREHMVIVRLSKPISITRETVLGFSGAGTWADLGTWQKASNLRAQLRQMKRDMKLKHAAIVSGPGIKKPPRVIRETEVIERLLTDVVDNPKGCATSSPDFVALQKKLLEAIVNDPFESNRTLPELDPDSLQGMALVKGAKFTDSEIKTMKDRLRGADLPAWEN